MQSCASNITLTGPKTPREKAMEKKQDTDQNIQVFLRCRPLDTSRQPPEKRAPLEVDRIRREVKVTEKNADKGTRSFFFDDVYDASIGQCEVYDGVVKPLVHEVLQGYNCTVFAYGQTGTGKTYTMEGSRSDYECSWQDDPKAGIVPRALDQLFETLSERGSTEHTISVSYMELYNENLYDLLSPCTDLVKLNIYEDNVQKGKVKVGNLAEISVAKKDEIFEILRKGSAKRQTAATKLNACSSRSHTIFSVTVRMKDLANLMDGEEIYRIGKLNLVDLAGSENIGRSGAVEKRATEAGQINRSLLTLGRVITCLVEKQSHIPYRESKLTRLLQDSLGGRTKTSIIATISPSTLDLEDTLSTLEYAQRAKKITNKPELNQKLTKNTVLKELTAEIERLRRDVDASRGAGNAFFIAKENYDQMSDQIDRQTKDLEHKEKQLANLEEELDRTKVLFGETSANLEKKTEQLHEVRSELHSIKEALNETKNQLKAVSQERDEQKYLVQAHVETEKELGTQARVLLDVANTSTTHVERLHRKVDRVKQIEEANSQAASNFMNCFEKGMQTVANFVQVLDDGQLDVLQNSLETKFDTMQAHNTSLRDDITSMSTCLSSKLAENLQMNEKDTMQHDLQELSQHFKLTSCLHSGQSTSLSSQIDSACKESTLNLRNANQLAMDQRAALEAKILEISGTLCNGRDLNAENRQKLANEISGVFSTLIDRIDSLQVELNNATEKIKQTQMINRKAAQNFTGELSACQQDGSNFTSSFITFKRDLIDQLNQFEERMTKQTQSQSQLVTKHESLVSDLLKSGEECSSLAETATANCSTLARVCKDNSSHVKSVVDAASIENETLLENVITSINALDETHSKHLQEAIDKLNQAESAVTSTFESLVCVVGKQKENIQKELGKCVSQTNHLAQAAGQAVLERSSNLTSLANDMSAHAENLCQKVVEQIDNLTESKEATVNEVSLLKVQTKMAQKNLLKELDDRSSEVKSLVQAGLKKDTPTGQTPMKTSFNYPKHLAQTSPHPRILSRFRQTLENMQPE